MKRTFELTVTTDWAEIIDAAINKTEAVALKQFRGTNELTTFVIEYDTEENLLELGYNTARETLLTKMPNSNYNPLKNPLS